MVWGGSGGRGGAGVVELQRMVSVLPAYALPSRSGVALWGPQGWSRAGGGRQALSAIT